MCPNRIRDKVLLAAGLLGEGDVSIRGGVFARGNQRPPFWKSSLPEGKGLAGGEHGDDVNNVG